MNSRFAVRSTILACLALLAGCATPEGQREPAPFAPSRGVVGTPELPTTHFTTDGTEPLHLRVTDGEPPVLEAATEADANLVVRLVARDHDMTTFHLKQAGERTLKLDLWISPDGGHWQYTSSCPLRGTVATYENWPQDVRFLAVANARWIAGGQVACE
ncbi:MAG TPA: hypothetical protein VFL14_00695 [Xanthomonadales bacterium]|nr:hypothetical protein [Xanthomonadales bacterium]